MSHPLRACQDCGGEGGFYTPEDPRYWRLGGECLEQWDPCPSCAGSGWERMMPAPAGTAATPGPWTFHQPWAGFSKITGPNGELIFGIAAGTPEEKQPDEVCYANARLIAAAPSLYEALDHVEAVMSIVQPRDHTKEYLETLAEVRAALALARGKAP